MLRAGRGAAMFGARCGHVWGGAATLGAGRPCLGRGRPHLADELLVLLASPDAEHVFDDVEGRGIHLELVDCHVEANATSGGAETRWLGAAAASQQRRDGWEQPQPASQKRRTASRDKASEEVAAWLGGRGRSERPESSSLVYYPPAIDCWQIIILAAGVVVTPWCCENIPICSFPLRTTVPSDGSSSRTNSFSSVDLPAPFRPLAAATPPRPPTADQRSGDLHRPRGRPRCPAAASARTTIPMRSPLLTSSESLSNSHFLQQVGPTRYRTRRGGTGEGLQHRASPT